MTLQKDRLALEKERENANTAHAFYLWAKAHPELNCQANVSVLSSYLNGDTPTPEVLEEATQLLLAKGRLAVKKPEQILAAKEQEQQSEADKRLQEKVSAAGHRADVSAEILFLIFDSESRNYEAKQQKYKTIEQLETRLAELKLEKQLSRMSRTDVKKFIQIEREKKTPPVTTDAVTPLDGMTKSDIRKLTALELRALISYPNGQPNIPARKKLEQIMGRTKMKGRELLPGDLELFLKRHDAELQNKLHQLGLQDSHHNGQVIIRYLRDHQDLEITVENIFSVVNTPGYREYLEFVLAGPAEPTPVQLSVSAQQIKRMDREAYRALRYSHGADRVSEVDAAITAIVSGAPIEEKIATGADRLYQLGVSVNTARPNLSKQPAKAVSQDSLQERRLAWDVERRNINMIEITNPVVNKLDHGATNEAKKLALRVLGERP